MSDLLIPDFKVYTAPMELVTKAHPLFPGLPESTEDSPVVTMVGSSTEQDLHEDTMQITALQDMCDVPVGLSIWRNHDYTVPDSYFGKLLAKPVIVAQNDIADLHLASSVYPKEEGARRTYEIIKDGGRIGVSGGFIILEWGFDGDVDDWWAPIIIHRVKALEWSTVGIPANQRSWVENGIGGLFKRYIREEDGDNALKLAPAFKGLFSNDYKDLIKSIRSEGLRKELEKKPVRAGNRNRLSWEPDKKHFLFQTSGRTRVVTPEEIPELIKTYSTKPKTEAQPMNKDAVTEESTPSPETIEEPTTPQEETPVVEEVTTTEESTEEPTIDVSEVPNIKAYANTLLDKAFSDLFFAIKAGAQISKENAGYVEQIHSMVCSLVGNMHCEAVVGTTSNDDDQQKSIDAIVAKAVETFSVHALTVKTHNNMDGVIKALEAFTASLEPIKDLPGLQTEMSVLTKAAVDIRSSLDEEFGRLKLRVNAINDDLHSLTNMPLGNPKQLERHVEPSDNVTTHQELLNVNKALSGASQNLTEALALTDIVTEKRLDGAVIEYRHWPEGVGKGVRPALTLNQQSYMHPQTWSQYNAGLEAYVPKIDDPLDKLEKAASKR